MAFEDTYRMSVHAVITDGRNGVLLLRQTYGNLSWGLPGGAVDPGETVLDTLRRECREELGCEVSIGPVTGIYYHKQFNSHVLLFRCTLDPKAAIQLSEEHSEYKYAPLGELTPVQRRRVEDCLNFDGLIGAAVF